MTAENPLPLELLEAHLRSHADTSQVKWVNDFDCYIDPETNAVGGDVGLHAAWLFFCTSGDVPEFMTPIDAAVEYVTSYGSMAAIRSLCNVPYEDALELVYAMGLTDEELAAVTAEDVANVLHVYIETGVIDWSLVSHK